MNPSQMPDGQLAEEKTHAEVPIAPAVTPPGTQLLEEERLKVENYYLKMQLLNQQIESLDTKKAMAYESIRELSKELDAYRAELSKKYQTPIQQDTVTPEGRIKREDTSWAGPGWAGR